ncbi:MAG: DMT family transporter [Chloroflexota bacterium]
MSGIKANLPQHNRRKGLAMAVLAVLMFSSSAVLVRLSAPIDPLTVTFARLFLGSIIVMLMSRVFTGGFTPPSRQEIPRFLLIGLCAAAHFVLYIVSLSYTSIAHNLSLIYTAPIWVTIFSRMFLKEPFPARKWPAILLTVTGIAIMAGFDPQMDREMLFGDILALGSGITLALYSIAGRSTLKSVPVLTYAATIYGLAAIFTAIPGIAAFDLDAVNWSNLAAVVGAAFLSLGFGHTLFNASLSLLHPTIVNVVATQEVTAGVIMGAIVLSEIPPASTIAGAVIALIGVIWTLTVKSSEK